MSSARYGLLDCVGVAFGVAALADVALVSWWDVVGGFGTGLIVALNPERPLLAFSSFALAGPAAEVDSVAGRAGERRAVLGFGGLATGLSWTAGNSGPSVELS